MMHVLRVLDEPITVRLLTGEAEWDELAPAWNRLHELSPHRSVVLRFDWLRTWWRVYASAYAAMPNGLRILTAWRGSELIGLLPLYQCAHSRMPLALAKLAFISTGESELDETCPDYLNVLSLPGEEDACISAFWNILHAAQWDQVDLLDVPSDSPIITRGTRPHEARCAIARRDICAIANLEGGFEAYLKRLTSHARQQARRHIRAAARCRARLEFASGDAVGEAFDELVRLHQSQWQKKGKPGCFGSRRFTEFHRLLVALWAPSGKAMLARLSIDDKAVAIMYGFVCNSKFDGYQCGTDMSASKILPSPGIVGHLLLMKRLADLGITRYDFLRGSALYKKKLATEYKELSKVIMVRPSLRTATHGSLHAMRRALHRGRQWFV